MFASKISALSLFVFCLFTLGQAAPVLDDVSYLSTRDEAPSFDLVTRGFFKNLFHKADPATQKRIDHVSEVAHCKTLHILLDSEKAYLAAKHDLIADKDKLTVKGTKSSDPVVKAYEKRIKKFATLAKKLESKIKDTEASLKKLGVTNGPTHCKAAAEASTTTTTTSAAKPSSTDA